MWKCVHLSLVIKTSIDSAPQCGSCQIIMGRWSDHWIRVGSKSPVFLPSLHRSSPLPSSSTKIYCAPAMSLTGSGFWLHCVLTGGPGQATWNFGALVSPPWKGNEVCPAWLAELLRRTKKIKAFCRQQRAVETWRSRPTCYSIYLCIHLAHAIYYTRHGARFKGCED